VHPYLAAMFAKGNGMDPDAPKSSHVPLQLLQAMRERLKRVNSNASKYLCAGDRELSHVCANINHRSWNYPLTI
jgi:hypothetical protein